MRNIAEIDGEKTKEKSVISSEISRDSIEPLPRSETGEIVCQFRISVYDIIIVDTLYVNAKCAEPCYSQQSFIRSETAYRYASTAQDRFPVLDIYNDNFNVNVHRMNNLIPDTFGDLIPIRVIKDTPEDSFEPSSPTVLVEWDLEMVSRLTSTSKYSVINNTITTGPLSGIIHIY